MRAVVEKVLRFKNNVGWVERSDTHHRIPAIDGYRYAPPILREICLMLLITQ